MDALLLAAGEEGGVAVGLVSEADEIERLGDELLDFGAGVSRDFEREGDVLEHGFLGQDLEVLEDDAHLAPEVRDVAAA